MHNSNALYLSLVATENRYIILSIRLLRQPVLHLTLEPRDDIDSLLCPLERVFAAPDDRSLPNVEITRKALQ